LKTLNTTSLHVTCQPKLDGVSLSLVYGGGKLLRAVTRGNGREGEDVSKQARFVKGVLPFVKGGDYKDGETEVRGEVIMGRGNFEGLKGGYSNARNAASGVLRSWKGGVSSHLGKLVFIAYDGPGGMEEEGFFVPTPERSVFIDGGGVEELTEYHEELGRKREGMEFEIDGVVYKVHDAGEREALGYTSRAPRWAMAHKFPALEAVSRLEKVEYAVGRTGAITPVIVFGEVEVGGVKVRKATGNNWGMLRAVLGGEPRVGDEVYVERAGDVIPKVVKASNLGEGERVGVEEPKGCPSCGGGVGYEDIGDKEEGKVLRCLGPFRVCKDR